MKVPVLIPQPRRVMPAPRFASALTRALLLSCAISAALPAGEPPALRLQGQRVSAEGFYQFFFEAEPGQTYPVQASFDTIHWTLLTNIVGGEGPVWVEDQEAPNFQRRFYHIGVPPPQLPTPIADMVFISAGTFTMGSAPPEPGRELTEGPETAVTLSRDFWMGAHEVTMSEYASVTGTDLWPAWMDHRLPADSMSWVTAMNYCSMLTAQERLAGRLPSTFSYRLPTEAEWEYACRAGTKTPVAIGDGNSLSSTQANFDGGFPYGGANSGPYQGRTAVVGSFPPNAWGLYDMHGNVLEFCLDWYGPYPGGAVTDPRGPDNGSLRVLRGGGFTSTGRGCRSAKRDSRSPTYAHFTQGLRVVLSEQH
jgi:sulfatase modifying factor 1